MEEFSELIARVPIDILKHTLMTHQQRLLAESFWEAANYGGSEAKCVKHLKELYGDSWRRITRVADHMESVRDYYEWILCLDHDQQWAKALKKR